jgi:hypothetical protein
MSRVRQKKIIAAYRAGDDGEYDRYVQDMTNECEKFRTAFYAAAGVFAVPPLNSNFSPRGILFQGVEVVTLDFHLFHKTYDFQTRHFLTGPKVRSAP